MHIRDYINAIEPLFEAVRYEDMFASFFARYAEAAGEEGISRLQSRVQTQVAEAKKVLSKNDRIVWYLRFLRIAMADALKYLDGEHIDLLKSAEEVELADYNKKTKGGRLTVNDVRPYYHQFLSGGFLVSLKHYLSLPIPEIQSTVFLWQSPADLLHHFFDLEKAWKEESTGLVRHDPEDGEVVIHFPNQFEWILLPRGYCKQEADAMGHCGNAGAARGDRILSLRKIVSKGDAVYHQIFLTFILDQNGYLGEMKGRGNDKPAARYHPYIVALLKLDLIRGIKGGGYLPENNFSVADLDESVREELVNAKPELGTISDTYRLKGMSEELGRRIQTKLNEAGIETAGWTPDLKNLIVGQFSNWQEAFHELKSKNSSNEYYLDTLDGTALLEAEGSHDEDTINDILRRLKKTHPDDYAAFTANLVASYPDEIKEWEDQEDEEFDAERPQDVSRLVKYLEDEHGIYDIAQAFYWASDDGARAGMEKEIYEAFESAFGSYGSTTSLVYKNRPDERGLLWDEPLVQVVHVADVLKVIDDEDALYDIDRNGWEEDEKLDISVPYYGFSGYDDDAAVESFRDGRASEIQWPVEATMDRAA